MRIVSDIGYIIGVLLFIGIPLAIMSCVVVMLAYLMYAIELIL